MRVQSFLSASLLWLASASLSPSSLCLHLFFPVFPRGLSESQRSSDSCREVGPWDPNSYRNCPQKEVIQDWLGIKKKKGLITFLNNKKKAIVIFFSPKFFPKVFSQLLLSEAPGSVDLALPSVCLPLFGTRWSVLATASGERFLSLQQHHNNFLVSPPFLMYWILLFLLRHGCPETSQFLKAFSQQRRPSFCGLFFLATKKASWDLKQLAS